MLTKEQIEAELHRLAPFHHEIALPYGLTTQPEGLSRRPGERARMADVLSHAWPALLERCGGSLAGKRVLDVGCNCGGFSFQAAADGAEYVLGVDVAGRYVEQANFIKDAIGAGGVEFRRLGVDQLDPNEIGSFDVTLCLGLLYHLENPVLSMRRLSELTGEVMVVDTNVDTSHDGAYWRMSIARSTGVDAKTASTSLWRTEDFCQFMPTPEAAEDLLRFLGFAEVARLTPHPGLTQRYLDGRRVALIATRS